MFWKSTKDREIEFLRSQVKDLQDRLMSVMDNSAFMTHKAEARADKSVVEDLKDQIESIPATTEKEKRDKTQALDQMFQIMGH